MEAEDITKELEGLGRIRMLAGEQPAGGKVEKKVRNKPSTLEINSKSETGPPQTDSPSLSRNRHVSI